MKKINLFALFSVLVIAGMCFTSCNKDESYSNKKISKEFSLQNNPSLLATTTTPNPSDFDEVYSVNLSDYVHVYQQGTLGMCGPCSYVSARSIRYPSYSANYSAAYSIKTQLDNRYGAGNWGLYQLHCFDSQISEFKSWPSGSGLWSSGRTNLKDRIKTKISQGKPCLIPCLYNMSTNTSSAGHFYVIVSLYLKNGGTGSIVGVKDVWENSSATYYFSYTDLLSSNWYNARKFSGVGNESYSVMNFK